VISMSGIEQPVPASPSGRLLALPRWLSEEGGGSRPSTPSSPGSEGSAKRSVDEMATPVNQPREKMSWGTAAKQAVERTQEEQDKRAEALEWALAIKNAKIAKEDEMARLQELMKPRPPPQPTSGADRRRMGRITLRNMMQEERDRIGETDAPFRPRTAGQRLAMDGGGRSDRTVATRADENPLASSIREYPKVPSPPMRRLTPA